MRPIALPSPVVGALLRPCYRLALNHRLPFTVQRQLLDAIAPVQTLPPGARRARLTLGGRPVERWTGSTATRGAVLYLHGGGYTVGSFRTHRSVAAYLSRAAGAPVYLLDYRLAPEHPYPAAVDDAVAAFDELISVHGYPPGQIAIAGDSAGGGLAVATTRRLVDAGTVPAALAVMAPWVDPNDTEVGQYDLVLNTYWSKACALAYLGAGDPNDPGYAPLLGPLEGLPPTLIHVASDELLRDQAVALADKLHAAGVDARLVEQPRLWHVAHLQAALVREAREAVDDLGTFIKQRLEAMSVEPPTRDVG
ncbi:alpha/beta hydrolase [Skermania sp. ID1734]|uniref:alpha/beta hydrolase n=1 Tax=Skermania sp. ID1734 TaxID=2597516 RepID=UPI001180F9D9|nr:alpha/beta hydrolase [Skermania sp. ID1734]TSE01885.1 alpha/beta hydrolase [Skermania sp. ID1734]